MRLKKVVQKAIVNRSFYQPIEYGWNRAYGLATGSKRLLPNFIIIGAQKCGTTSLFYYLSQHPEIYPSYPKEINFFSMFFDKGINWYRSHFPLALQKEFVERLNNHHFFTGEASPSYFASPHAARRVSEVLSNIVLLILLRNPVDRAYSHYHMSKKMGVEKLSFSEALEKEDERINPEIDKMTANEYYRSSDYLNYSYQQRGVYIDHILNWSDYFDRDQLMIINSEHFYTNPKKSLRKVEQFLGISIWDKYNFRRYAPGNYSPLDSKTRKRLQEFYKPYNQNLNEFLGVDFGWGD